MAPVLNGIPGWVLFLAVLALSLVLIFAGPAIVKVIAFLVAGLVGASIGAMLAPEYLSAGWQVLGLALGFVIGGLLGVLLVSVGIGLLVGYAAYLVASPYVQSSTLALFVGVAFFILGVVLSDRILTLVTAFAGGLLLFSLLRYAGLGPLVSTVLAAVVTFARVWVQYAGGRSVTQPTASSVGGQRRDRR
ncbi:MAG: hypothetical protein HY297_02970 [Thaumarchaeota archaeon]|nr:hypothetical protein [Nitrososphaerota archaeon]